jgi:hypothetical protein
MTQKSPRGLLAPNPLDDPDYNYATILPFRQRKLLDVDDLSTDGTELAVPGLLRDVGNAAVRMWQTAVGERPLDAAQVLMDTADFSPAGLLGRIPAGALGANTLRRETSSAINDASGGGRYSPPGGVPNGVPQPLLTYPPTHPPEWGFDPKKAGALEIDERPGYAASIIHGSRAGERKRLGDYLTKVNSPEALIIKKQVTAAQRDIDAGNYTPMFDVSKRTDVDPSKYKFGETTQEVAWAKQPKTRGEHRKRAMENGTGRLEDAFKAGLEIPDANNWYYMGQLEKAFVKKLGAEKGRAAFREKFAKPMAATTGGASPKENFRTAMYGNFLKENKIPYPGNAYDMPFPAGGRYISGNIAQHKKLMGKDAFNPKTNSKRSNFEANFLGKKEWATIDEQMSGLFDPKLKNPQGDSYGAYEEVVIKLAKRYGVSPREFQEVAWAGAKQAKEGKRYGGSKPMIQEVNEAIERTSRITGLSPQDVLEKGIIDSKIPIFSLPGAPAMGLLTPKNENRPGGTNLLGVYTGGVI